MTIRFFGPRWARGELALVSNFYFWSWESTPLKPLFLFFSSFFRLFVFSSFFLLFFVFVVLFLFSFSISFSRVFEICFLLASTASRFLTTFLIKTKHLSRLGEVPFGPSFLCFSCVFFLKNFFIEELSFFHFFTRKRFLLSFFLYFFQICFIAGISIRV